MLTVATARPDERDRALALLFARLDPDEQAEQIATLRRAEHRRELSLDGLVLARLNATPVAAAMLLPQPDRTAFVWPPVIDAEQLGPSPVSAETVAEALLGHIVDRLDDADLWLGQCLLEPEETRDRRRMERNGFAHLADLLYLVRPVNEPLPAPEPRRLEALTYDPASNHDRFVRVLEKTYVNTRDCPALNGCRTGDQALFGHRLSGEFDPARWKLYRAEGTDVGLLLMNDHPDQDAWEVVYMGIVPEARGRGYGRAMLLSGLHEARSAGRRAVLLAVDARNRYALKLYRDLGFTELLTRSVHARLRPQSPTA